MGVPRLDVDPSRPDVRSGGGCRPDGGDWDADRGRAHAGRHRRRLRSGRVRDQLAPRRLASLLDRSRGGPLARRLQRGRDHRPPGRRSASSPTIGLRRPSGTGAQCQMALPPTRRLRGVLAPGDVIRLEGDAVVMLDQTRLPGERVDRRCVPTAELCTAIRELAIRGAPAIGIAAAMGMAQAARRSPPRAPPGCATELAGARRSWPRRGRRRSISAGRSSAATRRSSRAPRAAAGRAAGGARAARAAHPRGRGRPLPRDGAPRRRAAARGRARAHALQRRRARDRRLRLGARRRARRARARSEHPRLGRRDATAAAGRAADRLGARARTASRTR